MTYRLRNLGLAIALAAVAVLLVFYYVSQERGRLQEDQELVPVWVAAKDIPIGTSGAELDASGFLTSSEVERGQVAPGALLDPADVATKVVAEPIYKGEQVSQLRFRSEAEKGIRAQLTGNLRAVQVPGNGDQLLAGTLQAGDHVDVVASIKYKFLQVPGNNAPENLAGEELVATRTVLRDILVLRGPKSEGGSAKITDNAQGGGNSVILAVTDAQSQKLAFVTRPDGAAWMLQLRPVTDSVDSPEGVETVGTVLTDGLKAQQLALLIPGGAR
jgi:Flp pilus assembly protein CpaB